MLIKNFLDGQNTLQSLHANFPQIEEAVRQCKEAKERALEMESLYSSDLPENRLKTTLSEYVKSVTGDVASLTHATAQILGAEAVADWLLRCPLDFSVTPLNGHGSI